MMSKKNISSIIFLSVFIVAVVLYFLYPKFVKKDGDPWAMIPDNTALILELPQPSQFTNKIIGENSIWQSASKSSAFKRLEMQLAKLNELLSDDESYVNTLNTSPLLISFHDNGANDFSSLFLSQIRQSPSISDVKAYLVKKLGVKYGVIEINEKEINGLKIIDAVNELTTYLIFMDGVMLASEDLNLISHAHDMYRSSSENFSKRQEFQSVSKTGGKKVDAKLYLNYTNLSALLKLHSSENKKDALSWLSGFAGWTETDIIVKDDEILLTGFTSFSCDSLSFLNLIKNQKPQKSLVYNVCPFNTDILIRLAFSDYSSVYSALNNQDASLSSFPGLNYDLSEFIQLIGQEVAFSNNAANIKQFKSASVAFVHLKDRHRAETILADLSKFSGGSKSNKINGYNVRQIKYKSLLSNMFGSVFSPITENFYLFIGDFVVFANSKEKLLSVLQMYDTGKTLDLNDNFKKYSDNLSTESNVSLYIKPKDIVNLIPLFTSKEMANTLLTEKNLITDLQGFSFQFTNDGALSYSNFYLKLGSTSTEENLALWKIQLDDEIVGKPFLVKDHSINKFMVLAFDKSSSVYLIDNDGQLKWKKKIDGLPQGEIHQVDYFKNGKIQYLFNTRDFIYIIDKKGNYVKNYPKKLNPASTNSISLFDYNRKKDYRLMVALADKKVYNYNINGSKVDGWKEPRTQNIVNENVKRVVANNKDYILITDIDNRTIIVNRKGKERIQIKGDLEKARNSQFFVNRTNSKGIIITSNKKGKLTYIKSNGKLDYTDFGDYSKDHYFLYEDFNDDNSVDFIFVDGRKLKVFDRFKKELFSYSFDYEINIQPMFFYLGRKQSVLGIVSKQEKTIYLFDSNGNTIISRGIVGETPFNVGSLNNNTELNLITASGNTLYNYRLK